MLNVDNNEIHNAYQKSVKDKENLENENATLKHEVKRLQYILTHPNELEVYSKSVSNTSNDDSLESKRSSNLSDSECLFKSLYFLNQFLIKFTFF